MYALDHLLAARSAQARGRTVLWGEGLADPFESSSLTLRGDDWFATDCFRTRLPVLLH